LDYKLSEIVLFHRKKSGLTRNQLADLAGVGKTVIYDIEKGKETGILEEIEAGKKYRFTYFERYNGPAIALTMPVDGKEFVFDRFPPFFDGLLPEGLLLEGLLKQRKIDKFNYLSQLIAVGNDLVGAITVQEKKA
jgi:serine/threonine-protein kinase HipA